MSTSFCFVKNLKSGQILVFVHFFNIFKKPEIWEIFVNKFSLQFRCSCFFPDLRNFHRQITYMRLFCVGGSNLAVQASQPFELGYGHHWRAFCWNWRNTKRVCHGFTLSKGDYYLAQVNLSGPMKILKHCGSPCNC